MSYTERLPFPGRVHARSGFKAFLSHDGNSLTRNEDGVLQLKDAAELSPEVTA